MQLQRLTALVDAIVKEEEGIGSRRLGRLTCRRFFIFSSHFMATTVVNPVSALFWLGSCSEIDVVVPIPNLALDLVGDLSTSQNGVQAKASALEVNI